jgi:hypothetical protein
MELAGAKKYFGADPKNQWTWRPICDLVLRLTEGVPEPTLPERLRYQADKLGRKGGLTLLAELMPYPRKRADKTLGPYQKYNRFADYESYRAEMLRKRLPLLQSLFDMQCHRKLVVAYGKGDWDEFKKLFKTNWTSVPPFEWGRVREMAVVLTRHLSDRTFTPQGGLDRLASTVRTALAIT